MAGLTSSSYFILNIRLTESSSSESACFLTGFFGCTFCLVGFSSDSSSESAAFFTGFLATGCFVFPLVGGARSLSSESSSTACFLAGFLSATGVAAFFLFNNF